MDKPRIGYIGLGIMGGALARRLLREHALTVFDLSPERREVFAALGATVADSPAAVGAASDIVLTCLPTSTQVRDVIFGDNYGLIRGMKPGGIIVDQTSGATTATRAMAAELDGTGIELIDGPVSGGPRGADAGTIAIMVGGTADQYARVEPVLTVISPNVTHVGPLGAGHTLKAVNNMMSAANRLLAFEAVSIAAANGINPTVAVDVINKSSGRNSATLAVFPNQIFTDDFAARFTMALMEKDVALAAELAGERFKHLTLTPLILRNYHMGIDRFGRNGDIHDMLRFYEEAAGVPIAKMQPEATP
ncbi:NAD(P)-dependent oxidoreductase [Rhodopila sp.]|uniref:NAD(P)-dependent oxidoreductase n=1 Tax=Rhodopila sp. TaxID=2480087 RepID=UPI002B62F834|nr:NAD(P)-dependent oxidoreductase [Rhodopila sp.]HVZ09575.1 NAD(P)-dependent oxidoreductase [Rhodopila sp.]